MRVHCNSGLSFYIINSNESDGENMSTTEEINNYFKGGANKDEGLTSYYGNPNYLSLLPDGKTYQDVTLDDLGFNSDSVKFELKGMVADLINPVTGEDYTDKDYQSLINQYVSEAETKFDIVIRPRLKVDRADYFHNDFNAYMYIRTENRPIIYVENAKIYFNNQTVFNYKSDWIKVTNRMGQVQVQPTLFQQGFTEAEHIPFAVSTLLYGLPPVTQNEYSPQMIGLRYIAGMLPQPPEDYGINRDVYPRPELISWVAKKAAIGILERWGRNIIGPGIASTSVSIDGISSTLNTTQSAEYSATKAEIDTLNEEIKEIEAGLQSYYGRNVGIIV